MSGNRSIEAPNGAGEAPSEPEPGAGASAGWRARLDLRFEQREGRTVLVRKRQQGPLTVQRPFYPEGGVCHLYLLHPPGGVVGGDRLEIDAALAEGAHVLITTPGAAKLYRSAGARATQQQRLRIGNGTVLEWLPHENILFPGTNLGMHTQVELSGHGRFIGWEIHCFGRPAIRERFTMGRADLAFTLHRDGKPILLERMRLGAEDDLTGPSTLRGYPLCGTLVASGADVHDLEAVRQGMPTPGGDPAGVTLVDDLLIARSLGYAVEPVRRLLTAVWGILRPRLLDRPACVPRIWAT